METRATRIMGLMNKAEEREVVQLKKRLREELANVERITTALEVATTSTAALAEDITLAGFSRLHREIQSTIMQADMGIVDVYWLRKTEVVDEITRLSTDRSQRLDELEQRFSLIRQKMEE